MASVTKRRIVEALYGPYEGHAKAPDGLSFPRYYAINSKKTILYQASDFNEWITILRGPYELGRLTSTSLKRMESTGVILLNPIEAFAPKLELETLGC